MRFASLRTERRNANNTLGPKQRCRRSLPDWTPRDARYLEKNPPTPKEWTWIIENQPMIYAIAKRTRPEICELAEGWQDIVDFLIPRVVNALRVYDPARGFKLSTYVGRAIVNALNVYVTCNPRLTVVPGFGRARFSPPILLADQEPIIAEEPPPPEIGDLLDRIAVAFAELKPRHAVILDSYLGLTGEPKTLQAVGNEIGLTKERVRQIVATALRRITLAVELTPTVRSPVANQTGRKRLRSGLARFRE